jgi:hypothetical protein
MHSRLQEFRLYVVTTTYGGELEDTSITDKCKLTVDMLRSIYRGNGQSCIIARVPQLPSKSKLLIEPQIIRSLLN